MRLEEGITLLSAINSAGDVPEQWVDLGCGAGFFTNVLAHMLPHNSSIEAIDKKDQELPSFMGNNVRIHFKKTDFAKSTLELTLSDGILIANALHYVKDKLPFIRHIKQYLKKEAPLIIVEYDTNEANTWVPYPVSFTNLTLLLQLVGFKAITKIAEMPSNYNKGNLYSVTALTV